MGANRQCRHLHGQVSLAQDLVARSVGYRRQDLVRLDSGEHGRRRHGHLSQGPGPVVRPGVARLAGELHNPPRQRRLAQQCSDEATIGENATADHILRTVQLLHGPYRAGLWGVETGRSEPRQTSDRQEVSA